MLEREKEELFMESLADLNADGAFIRKLAVQLRLKQEMAMLFPYNTTQYSVTCSEIEELQKKLIKKMNEYDETRKHVIVCYIENRKNFVTFTDVFTAPLNARAQVELALSRKED